MKRFANFLLVTAIIGLAAFIWGCSDDDTGTNPGDINDPDFQMFSSEFEGMDEMNGIMFLTTLGFIDTLVGMEPAASPKITDGGVFEYHEASQYWYCSTSVTSDDDVTFTVIDSMQFRHGDNIVQWPKEDSITQVNSHSWLNVSAPGVDVDTLHAYQTAVLVLPEAGSDTLIVNGTGGFVAEYTISEGSGVDSTLCDVATDYSTSYTDLKVLHQLMDSLDVCPFSGSIAFTGTMNAGCSGPGGSGSISGTWNVTQAFNYGTVTITVTDGESVWTITDDCDAGTGSSGLQ